MTLEMMNPDHRVPSDGHGWPSQVEAFGTNSVKNKKQLLIAF